MYAALSPLGASCVTSYRVQLSATPRAHITSQSSPGQRSMKSSIMREFWHSEADIFYVRHMSIIDQRRLVSLYHNLPAQLHLKPEVCTPLRNTSIYPEASEIYMLFHLPLPVIKTFQNLNCACEASCINIVSHDTHATFMHVVSDSR